MSLLRYSNSISSIFWYFKDYLEQHATCQKNQFARQFAFDHSRDITCYCTPRSKDEMRNDRRFRKLGKKNRLSRNVGRLSFAEKRTASGNAAQCNLIRANTKIARRSLFASLSLVILFRRLTVKSQNFPYTTKICTAGSEAFINFSASIFRARVITRI